MNTTKRVLVGFFNIVSSAMTRVVPVGMWGCLLLLFTSPVLAQGASGSNDSSFNTLDVGNFGEGPDSPVYMTILQPNGKVLIGGAFRSFNGVGRNNLARLNPNGSLDQSFQPGLGVDGYVSNAVLQPDGKLVITGEFSTYDGVSRKGIARIQPDGSLDNSFHPGEGVSGSIYDIALQPDGRLIIGGSFLHYDGMRRTNIARLQPDGSLDASFVPPIAIGGLIDVYAIALQADGKVVVAGTADDFSNSGKGIARLDSNGSLDPSFQTGVGFCAWSCNSDYYAAAVELAIQPDGKILAGGQFVTYNGTVRPGLVRIAADGSLDPTFQASGYDNYGANEIVLQSDGKLLILNGSKGVVRLNPDGSKDTSFTYPESSPSAKRVPGTLALASDGSVFVAGTIENSISNWPDQGYEVVYGGYIQRLAPNGSADPNFGYGSSGMAGMAGANGRVGDILLQQDGKAIVAGTFSLYNGVSQHGLARLNVDGSLDANFSQAGAWSLITQMALQPDGKVLMCGGINSYGGVLSNGIVRVLADGSLDTTFDPGAGPNFHLRAIAVQPDGRIIIAGAMTYYNFVNRERIARIHPDGSLDLSFHPGDGPNGDITAVALQTDGKILIGGQFNSYGGVPCGGIARLNQDGSLDTAFHSTRWGCVVGKITHLQDGKLLVAGCPDLVRLNNNGSDDNTFSFGAGATFTDNPKVRAVSVQPDGKLLVGGSFHLTHAGGSCAGLARLHADGSIDSSFTTNSGFNKRVVALALQPDGKVLAGGDFTSFDGIPRHCLARLYAYEPYSNFCDGPQLACPCANTGLAGSGCANSVTLGGAQLAASGVASILNDSLVLTGTGMPNGLTIYLQGTSDSAIAFGDGIRCVGGEVLRVGAKSNTGGASSYPAAGDLPVSVRGMVQLSSVRHYQAWYRDSAAYCTPATFNSTNGVRVQWAP